MKKSLALLFAVFFCVSASAAEKFAVPSAKMFESLKGEDWSRLTESEKQRFVYTGIGGLERQGILLMRSPQDYMEAIGKVLEADPEMKKEYLDNLFVFCVYDGEPQTREGLRRIQDETRASRRA